MAPMVTPKLHVITHKGQIFTSLNVSSLPATIPPIPRPWNPILESDSSSDSIKDALTTQWAYETRPWFPLIAACPNFDGAVFACLNHLLYSLPIESTPDGCYILRGDVCKHAFSLVWPSPQTSQRLWVPEVPCRCEVGKEGRSEISRHILRDFSSLHILHYGTPVSTP
ncbi:hypothetical protein DFJ58DRAFT_726707 [Suillus subalutaceus]|uniref:uncharacterized protein n=1 Tax=Suillus subalutaceus TaxID=48586 RepID=UPI001B865F00|nr:uncharacterized protein DFJ58DRAFT_726707 [Suillus subalutaceus]KAG1858002.1 hypothetical protein DFJ58DRAFT_726707 [Suillus subalutaceus]